MLQVHSNGYLKYACIFFTLLLPATGSARDTYFSPNCGSCHALAAPTCNGCHVHGSHPDYLASAVGTLNLKVTTDKTNYVEGEPITITLAGGHMADFKGWVGVRVYDASGLEVTRKQAQLGCAPAPTQFGNKCDLPMKLAVPAKFGWTKLYASWAGNQFDRAGAAYGNSLGNIFGVGRRPLTDGGGNQVINHIEEIVVTGEFSVALAPPTPIPTPTPTPVPSQEGAGAEPSPADSQAPATPHSTTKKAPGGGAFDLAFILCIVFMCVISYAAESKIKP